MQIFYLVLCIIKSRGRSPCPCDSSFRTSVRRTCRTAHSFLGFRTTKRKPLRVSASMRNQVKYLAPDNPQVIRIDDCIHYSINYTPYARAWVLPGPSSPVLSVTRIELHPGGGSSVRGLRTYGAQKFMSTSGYKGFKPIDLCRGYPFSSSFSPAALFAV